MASFYGFVLSNLQFNYYNNALFQGILPECYIEFCCHCNDPLEKVAGTVLPTGRPPLLLPDRFFSVFHPAEEASFLSCSPLYYP